MTSDELRFSSLVMHLVRSPRPTKQETREQILQKADELFRLYGVGKTNVADIARELGMSPANIYKFFPAKSAIIEACAERGLGLIESEITAITDAPGGAMDRIGRIVLAVYRLNREMLRNERRIFSLVMTAVEENWQCVQKYRGFLLDTMARLLDEGVRSGEFAADPPPQTAQALLDSLTAPLRPHLQLDYNRDGDEEARVRAQIEFLARALRAKN